MLVNTFLNTSWLTFSSSNVNPCSASFNVLFAMKRAFAFQFSAGFGQMN